MFWLGVLGLAVLVCAVFIHGCLKIAAAQSLLERERDYQDWLRMRDRQALHAVRNGKVKA